MKKPPCHLASTIVLNNSGKTASPCTKARYDDQI